MIEPTRVEEILTRRHLTGEEHQVIGAVTDIVALIEEQVEAGRLREAAGWNADLTALGAELNEGVEILTDLLDYLPTSVAEKIMPFLDAHSAPPCNQSPV